MDHINSQSKYKSQLVALMGRQLLAHNKILARFLLGGRPKRSLDTFAFWTMGRSGGTIFVT